MNVSAFENPETKKSTSFWLVAAFISAIAVGYFIAGNGMGLGVMLIAVPFAIAFVITLFLKPRFGFIFFIIYCFAVPVLCRFFPGLQYGLGQDGLLVLIFLAIIFNRSNRFRYRHLNNDLVWMAFAWLIITVLEIGNPEKPSINGWFFEARSITFYWILAVTLSFLLLNKKSDIDLFLKIVITISVIAALYGMKQLYFGVNQAEINWLEAGAKKTHLLFGKLRVFSFYTEAGQFGASMAHISVLCIILATGPYSKPKKLFFLILGLILFYGMLISGTRGALFALAGGGFTYLALSKQLKILILGGIIGLMAFGVLKYTSIGSGNAEIVRLRTSLDPNDPSLMTRLNNQIILRDYLKTRPLGAGVGTIGMWGLMYNKHLYVSTIPPDSLYVKVWAMYGIVGFLIWFGIMLYIVGKMAGIIWNTRDLVMRNKLAAMCSGATGVLLCSYGNEVMNQMPSSIICYVSWVLIWLSPRWDTPLELNNKLQSQLPQPTVQ